jgi:hypothetical protein
MKLFLTAWARGVGIFAFYICLSLAIGILGFLAGVLPPVIAIPVFVVLGPAVIYWVSIWLAPDLFADRRRWWRREIPSRR